MDLRLPSNRQEAETISTPPDGPPCDQEGEDMNMELLLLYDRRVKLVSMTGTSNGNEGDDDRNAADELELDETRRNETSQLQP